MVDNKKIEKQYINFPSKVEGGEYLETIEERHEKEQPKVMFQTRDERRAVRQARINDIRRRQAEKQQKKNAQLAYRQQKRQYSEMRRNEWKQRFGVDRMQKFTKGKGTKKYEDIWDNLDHKMEAMERSWDRGINMDDPPGTWGKKRRKKRKKKKKKNYGYSYSFKGKSGKRRSSQRIYMPKRQYRRYRRSKKRRR